MRSSAINCDGVKNGTIVSPRSSARKNSITNRQTPYATIYKDKSGAFHLFCLRFALRIYSQNNTPAKANKKIASKS